MRTPSARANDPEPVSASARRAVAVAAVAAGAYVAGTWVGPVLVAAGSTAGAWLHLAYAPLCHQLAERSLWLGGVPLAVCARCTGLYAGGLAGLVVGVACLGRRDRGPRPRWLALVAAPTAIDALLPWIGLPQLSEVPRALLAIPCGVLAGWYLAVGVAGLVDRPAVRAGWTGIGGASPLEETDG